MSRSASTAERTEEIILNLTSPNCTAYAFLEVDNGGSWQFIEDIDMQSGINWSEAGKNEKFANYSLTPLPGTVSFKVFNENGKYFPGSGQAQSNLFDLETKVRLNAGYILDSGSSSTETLNLNDVAGQYVHSYFYGTVYNAGDVDTTHAYASTRTHFQDYFLPLYDSVDYDSTTYSPDAYTVQTYDTKVPGFISFDKFTVTADNTAGTIYYRTFDEKEDLDYSTLSKWTSGGATENGTKEVDFTDIDNDRYIQVAVVYDGIEWGTTYTVSQIQVTIISKFESLYKSVYYLDRPSFTDPKAPLVPMINCSGRDIFKRAIGIDVKYSDVNGLDIDDIIKSICDKVGIAYSASSIADLSSFSSRVTIAEGNDNVIKAEKLLDQCMQIINTTGYVMYTLYEETEDDNILYVQERPALADTTGAFSYLNYESIGDTSKNNGKLLQRITALTDTQVTEDEVQLDTEAITTTGAKSLTWSGNAVYKRLEVDEPDNITVSNLSVNPTSISFTVDSVSGTVNVTAHGNKYPSTNPVYEGESISWDNMTALSGVTSRLENPLYISDAECKSVADSFITQFGTPIFEAKGLKYPYLNLIPELNDGYLLWRRYVGGTSADDIYIITKMMHHFDLADKPRHYTSFNLEDSGSNYSDIGGFIYDASVDYDKGIVYDMGISTPLSTDEEIDDATPIINNIGF